MTESNGAEVEVAVIRDMTAAETEAGVQEEIDIGMTAAAGTAEGGTTVDETTGIATETGRGTGDGSCNGWTCHQSH